MTKKIIKIAGLSIIGFVVVIIYIVYLFTTGMCGDKVIGKYVSPDAKHTIDYFVRSCGATTGFVNNIELDGNLILRAEPNDGNLSAPFQIIWDGNKKVSIGVETTTNSFRIYTKQMDKYGDIDIQLDQKIIDSYHK